MACVTIGHTFSRVSRPRIGSDAYMTRCALRSGLASRGCCFSTQSARMGLPMTWCRSCVLLLPSSFNNPCIAHSDTYRLPLNFCSTSGLQLHALQYPLSWCQQYTGARMFGLRTTHGLRQLTTTPVISVSSNAFSPIHTTPLSNCAPCPPSLQYSRTGYPRLDSSRASMMKLVSLPPSPTVSGYVGFHGILLPWPINAMLGLVVSRKMAVCAPLGSAVRPSSWYGGCESTHASTCGGPAGGTRPVGPP